MDQFELFSVHHQQTRFTDADCQSKLSETSSRSSRSSDSSNASSILSMCPLLFDSSDNSPITKTNPSENESLCKICKKVKSINQFNTCGQCHQEELTIRSESIQVISTDQNSNRHIVRSQSLTFESTSCKGEKLHIENKTTEIQKKDKKKFSYNHITKFLRSHGYLPPKTESSSQSSSISTTSCLHQILLRPQLSVETTVIETRKSPPSTTNNSPRTSPPSSTNNSPRTRLPSIRLTPERIQHYQQRQIELDRVIQKLVESITRTTNENITEIPKYWSYLKQSCLNQIQPKIHRSQIFNYLLKSSSSDKQMEIYLEENEAIKARLDIVSTIIPIVDEKYSISAINRLFDIEEQTMIENLRSQLEFLLSSYSDELLFIHERIRFYQSNPHEEKNPDWIQIIKGDYPFLIEKMSNDFIIKVPQIEHILILMLQNMKRRLLSTNPEITQK
jgi:hypothetical protein